MIIMLELVQLISAELIFRPLIILNDTFYMLTLPFRKQCKFLMML